MKLLDKIKKTIADKLMQFSIKRHLNDCYFKVGVTPTTEQVIMDIAPDKLRMLCQQGYTVESIEKIIDEAIKEHK